MHNQNKQYSFTKEEKLCSKKQITLLFKEGRWERAKHIKLVYKIIEGETYLLPKVLITVPKSHFKRAVIRNKIKRRIREAYRLNKLNFHKIVLRSNMQLILGFVYGVEVEVTYSEIENDVKDLLELLSKKVNSLR